MNGLPLPGAAAPRVRPKRSAAVRFDRPVALVNAWLWACSLLLAAGAHAQPSADGPPASESPDASTFVVLQDGQSDLLEATAQALLGEAKAMFGAVSVERAHADFTAQGAAAAVDRAHARDDVRGLIVLGPLTTQAVVKLGEKALPTVAVLGAPLAAHGLAADDPRPLVGAGTGLSFAGEAAVLARLAPQIDRLHVPVSPAVQQALPQLETYLAQASRETGLEVRALALETAAALPEGLRRDGDALYLGLALPPTLPTDALLAAAAERGVAVVAGLSTGEVVHGALMSVTPDNAPTLRARQAVLAMYGLLNGEDPAQLRAEMALAPSRAVASDWALPFTLNAEVAHALGLEPSFTLLQSADVVEGRAVERTSFERAVARSLEANRSLAAAHWQLEGGAARVRQARGGLMPQVVANASGTWIDDDRAAGPFPPAERVVAVGGSASQTIYSADRIGATAVEKRLQTARGHDYSAARLDVTLDAAVRYVELMRARVIVDIAEQRVRSSRANLALAEGRERAGDVGRDEIFRWRVDLAESQQALVRAKATLAQAVANLNEVQAYEAQRQVTPEEPDGSALPILATDPRLADYFERPSGLRALQTVAFERALRASPGLAAAKARVAAADRYEKQQRRTMLAPDVDLVASLTGRVWNDGRGSDVPPIPGLVVPDNLDWSMGVVATLPLFEGLSQKSAVDEASAEARRLRAEQEALALQLSRAVYNALQEASAAYQNTVLATAAAGASRENLELVRDAYTRGRVDVIRLVDAQTQAFANEATAKNAYHDFLIAFVAVERLLGQFSFGPDAMDADAFFRALAQQSSSASSNGEP